MMFVWMKAFSKVLSNGGENAAIPLPGFATNAPEHVSELNTGNIVTLTMGNQPPC